MKTTKFNVVSSNKKIDGMTIIAPSESQAKHIMKFLYNSNVSVVKSDNVEEVNNIS